MAFSSVTVAPALAARVAATLRKPCAEPGTPAGMARLAKLDAEAFLGERPAFGADDEREIAARAALSVAARTGRIGIETSISLALFGVDRCHALLHMLLPEPHGVTATKAGV